jgi:hypothetical protein
MSQELTIPLELLRQAEKAQRYVAIYVIWVVGERGVMLGTTRSPREMPAQAERFNKRQTDALLLWTAGEEMAERLVSAIKREAAGLFVHGSWYDIEPELAVRAIEAAADKARIDLFSTTERDRRIRAACTKAMLDRRLQPTPAQQTASDVVVPFPRLLTDRRTGPAWTGIP